MYSITLTELALCTQLPHNGQAHYHTKNSKVFPVANSNYST